MEYGYARVSTKKQLDGNSLEAQVTAIKAAYPGAKVVEEQASGAKERPDLNSLIGKLQEGDMLVITKLDRLARTAQSGLEIIEQLRNKGVKIHILNMGLIDNSAMGKLLITVLLAFAEFERSSIAERMAEGKDIARLDPGWREGRPFKYPESQLRHALELKETMSYPRVEELTGISKCTLIRAKKRYAARKKSEDR